jgi:hypothetical protein
MGGTYFNAIFTATKEAPQTRTAKKALIEELKLFFMVYPDDIKMPPLKNAGAPRKSGHL